MLRRLSPVGATSFSGRWSNFAKRGESRFPLSAWIIIAKKWTKETCASWFWGGGTFGWVVILNIIRLINITPILASRGISLLAVIHISINNQNPLLYLVFALSTLIFLFNFKPQREEFMIPCKSCAAWTSKAFEQSGTCPKCLLRHLESEGLLAKVRVWAVRSRVRSLPALSTLYRIILSSVIRSVRSDFRSVFWFELWLNGSGWQKAGYHLPYLFLTHQWDGRDLCLALTPLPQEVLFLSTSDSAGLLSSSTKQESSSSIKNQYRKLYQSPLQAGPLVWNAITCTKKTPYIIPSTKKYSHPC